MTSCERKKKKSYLKKAYVSLLVLSLHEYTIHIPIGFDLDPSKKKKEINFEFIMTTTTTIQFLSTR